METSEEVMEITEMTAEEATQALTVGDAPEGNMIMVEIPKSPCTARPKKDKHVTVPVCVSLRKLLCTKLTMEEKGKAVNIETNKEKEDVEDLVIEEDKDEGMEEKTEPAHPPTNLATYTPPWKGQAKVPKDLDESRTLWRQLLN